MTTTPTCLPVEPIITDKDTNETESKGLYNCSHASLGVWIRMLGPKKERSKKITNNRDEYATKDKLRNEEVKRRRAVMTSGVIVVEQNKLDGMVVF